LAETHALAAPCAPIKVITRQPQQKLYICFSPVTCTKKCITNFAPLILIHAKAVPFLLGSPSRATHETAGSHHTHRQHCGMPAVFAARRESAAGTQNWRPVLGVRENAAEAAAPAAIWTSSFGGCGQIATTTFKQQSFWLWRLT
jgi:hypothetical protein